MSRQHLIEARTAKLVANFGRYVRAYDDSVPFTGEQLAAHRKTIALRRRASTVRAAVESEQFVASLRETLLAWGIGRRASRLVGVTEFAAAIRAAVLRLEPLESLTIDADDLPPDIAGQLWLIIDSLGVVENKAKVVAGTKTLHHLLPDLVPPMDRAWTGLFFNFHLPEWQDPAGQRRIFHLAHTQFTNIARQVDPERFVTSAGWRTSRTKILDNAIIGFGKTELGELPPASDEPANQISFEVQGYPPAKSEALSMLGAGHSHAPRVRLLLESARHASATQDFQPIPSAGVRLDVVLYSPAGQNPADATNYLGGIGDVLEDKEQRGPLEHLGDLASVWLYRNDLQIKQVTYRELHADHVSYTVTVTESPASSDPFIARSPGASAIPVATQRVAIQAISTERTEEAAISEFYAYDNHHRDRARVHRSDCPWCNHGEGVQGGSSGANDQWLGPFRSAEDAYAEVAHRADISYCAFCRPQHD